MGDTSDMHILGAGKPAFLEFMRNLTPSVLVASIAFFLAVRLDFKRFDLSNWSTTLAFYGCALTAALAFWANFSNFLDNAFSPVPRLDRAMRRLRARKLAPSTLLMALAALTWRKKPTIVIEAFVAVVVVYSALFVGVTSAISAAATALRNGLQ